MSTDYFKQSSIVQSSLNAWYRILPTPVKVQVQKIFNQHYVLAYGGQHSASTYS